MSLTVIPVVVYPEIQQGKSAAHLLGLLSDEVLLHLLTLEVCRPMVADRLVVCQPLHDLLFLLWAEGPLLLILP